MPDFARKLLAVHRGTPEETVEFWDDLDRDDLLEPWPQETYNRLTGRRAIDQDGGRRGYRTEIPEPYPDEEERRWR